MSEQENSDSQFTLASNPGPSALLIAARERLGLSQKDVADKLFLTTSFIKYIDDGEFEKISKPVFVKGYLRTYARVVDLSGDDIVALYDAQLQATVPTPAIKGVTDEDVGTESITGLVLQAGIAGLVALLLVIGFIWWLVSDSEENLPQVTQSILPVPAMKSLAIDGPALTSPEMSGSGIDSPALDPSAEDPDAFSFIDGEQTSLDSEEFAAPVAQLQFQDSAQALISSRDESAEQGADLAQDQRENQDDPLSSEREYIPGPEDEIRQATLDVIIERTTDGERTFVSVDAGGFDQLELTFSEECWVEIEDGALGLIYKDLNREQEVLTVYGTPPFELLLGKATAVEMIYNGRPFDLEPFIGQDRTARLTVSE